MIHIKATEQNLKALLNHGKLIDAEIALRRLAIDILDPSSDIERTPEMIAQAILDELDEVYDTPYLDLEGS